MTSPQQSANESASGPAPCTPAHCTVVIDEPTRRRNVIYAILAVIVGGIVSLFPFLTGMAMFLDPSLKQRRQAALLPPGPADKPPMRRVATMGLLDNSGTPVQVPVIADLKDVWTVEPNQPIGAIYLRKVDDKVECLNAICPHAGCFIAYAADRKLFRCPCHNSSFQTDGTRIEPTPSPRDMDPLEVEIRNDDEIWVAFANYYPAKEHMERKPS